MRAPERNTRRVERLRGDNAVNGVAPQRQATSLLHLLRAASGRAALFTTTPSSSLRCHRALSCVALGKRGASRPLCWALRNNAPPFGGKPATPPPCVHKEWLSPGVITAQRWTPADERDALSQGVAAEQMVSIGVVVTGARALERVWSARSLCVVVVVETPQERSAPPSFCCHWAQPRTTVLVLALFSTDAGAGLERPSLTLLARCLLGNNLCLLLFCLVDGHHPRVCLVVVNRRGGRYQFHVSDLVFVVARRSSLASSPWRWRVDSVIVARWSPLRRHSTHLKHRGKRRSCVVVV